MDASGRNAIVTLLANLLSERLDEEQLAAAASVITQDRKSTRLNSSHSQQSRMPSSA